MNHWIGTFDFRHSAPVIFCLYLLVPDVKVLHHKIPVFWNRYRQFNGSNFIKLSEHPSQICSVMDEFGSDFRHYVETQSVLLLISIIE